MYTYQRMDLQTIKDSNQWTQSWDDWAEWDDGGDYSEWDIDLSAGAGRGGGGGRTGGKNRTKKEASSNSNASIYSSKHIRKNEAVAAAAGSKSAKKGPQTKK